MNIKSIKKEANLIYQKHRGQLIPEFFYVGYVSLLAQYLRSGLFSFFVSLFLSPITHGYVRCVMRIVDEDHPQLDYHDSMVGLLQFPRVAPVYLMRKAFILGCTLLCGLPMIFLLGHSVPELSLEWLSSLGNAFIQTELFIPRMSEIMPIFQNGIILFNALICAVVYLLLTALLMPVAYIMEVDEFSWSEALYTSMKMMKSYIVSFIRLYFQYFIRHFVYWMITGIVLVILGSINEILMLLYLITSLFLYIELFKGRFEIAKYLFYKEMRKDNEKKSYISETYHY